MTEALHTTPVEKSQVLLLGHKVSIESVPQGATIDVSGRVEDYYKGPMNFNAIVDFGDLPVKRGMRATRISKDEMWGPNNLPPEGIKILEFSDEGVKEALNAVAEIAKRDFYYNPPLYRDYYESTSFIFRTIFWKSDLKLGYNLNPEIKYLGLIRAGVVAGKMLDIDESEQIKVQTKRLPMKGEKPGNIAIGITFEDPSKMKLLDRARVLIADPAGATFSSVVANLLYLKHSGITPARVDIWNIVASHKGSLFALDALKEMGIEGSITAGGYSPAMDEHYYLETESGTPSVRDAGDALDSFLPSKYRQLQKVSS